MIYPWLRPRYRRVQRALHGYPLYDVPHKNAERYLPEDQARENFDYFLSVRKDRLAYFQSWLKREFGVAASLDGPGLIALNDWINKFDMGLIAENTVSPGIIFASYQPSWTDKYAGFNVLIDIGIFIGEYLIAKRPHLTWKLGQTRRRYPPLEKDWSLGYVRPVIGYKANDDINPLIIGCHLTIKEAANTTQALWLFGKKSLWILHSCQGILFMTAFPKLKGFQDLKKFKDDL